MTAAEPSGAPLDERLEALFAELSRAPDLDADELLPHDATDALLLRTAAEAGHDRSDVVIIGDRHGALALGALEALGCERVRVHQDAVLGERALVANASALGVDAERISHHPLDASLLAGATLVLVQLPRALAALDEIAWAVARWADPGATVLAGGRVKHMTPAMNDVLGRRFAEVRAGLARRKSRVLTAARPRPGEELGDPPFPVWGEDRALPFRLAAFGATFGGASLDRGSRLLLADLAGAAPAAHRIVDLGCGNGVLAVSAAVARAGAEVIATDQSAAAVAATRLTAEAAGVGDRVRVVRADGVERVPAGWADLVLLNPPFHSGAIVHAGVAHRLIRGAAAALAPGGELRIVFNSHLRYRPLLERAVGPVRQVARDRTFTVLAATRR